MIRILMPLLCCILLAACSNRIVDGNRHGFWKEYDTVQGKLYVSKGRYKNGFQVGKWRYKLDGNLVKKEKYRSEICHVIMYDSQKRVTGMGETRLDLSDTLAHWYYEGIWSYFDTLGNCVSKKAYHKGVLINDSK